MTSPRTRRQWQAAADAAQAGLEMDSCRQYGLIEGGPKFDLPRCEEILRQAAARGIRPCKDAGVTFVLAWNRQKEESR